MVKSIFQFTDPKLEFLSLQINQDLKKPLDGRLVDMEISTDISKKRITGENRAEVALNITIGEVSAYIPFFINIKMSSIFIWEDKLENNDIDELLSVNAPSLIFSYIRPIVALITQQSKYPSYNLPFMDFSKEITKE